MPLCAVDLHECTGLTRDYQYPYVYLLEFRVHGLTLKKLNYRMLKNFNAAWLNCCFQRLTQGPDESWIFQWF